MAKKLTRGQVELLIRTEREKGIKPNLRGADLSGIDLSGAILTEGSFPGYDYSGADMSMALVFGAKQANIGGITLRGANLQEANLSHTVLAGADLREANLSGADLTGADLNGADLSWANLEGVNLSGANLRGVLLTGANLSGTNLLGAVQIGANLNGVKMDEKTQLDPVRIEAQQPHGALKFLIVGAVAGAVIGWLVGPASGGLWTVVGLVVGVVIGSFSWLISYIGLAMGRPEPKPKRMRTHIPKYRSKPLARLPVKAKISVKRLGSSFSPKELSQMFLLKIVPAKIEMVTVPAGEFIMGRDKVMPVMREGPAHPVTLAEYQIGRYPITNGQYLHFVRDTGHQEPEHWTRAILYGESRNQNHPVVRVSWFDAVAYCNWLSQKTGKNYRLPTEAEWEKAARGHDGRHYPWGDKFEVGRCNCMGESVMVGGREYEIGGPSPAGTTPVGYYSPHGDSPYGVADMAGNVWEWCATKWLKPYPYDTTENEWSEVYLEGYTSRVRRGGSFGDICSDARATSRYRSVPLNKYGNLGFRVVASLNGSG